MVSAIHMLVFERVLAVGLYIVRILEHTNEHYFGLIIVGVPLAILHSPSDSFTSQLTIPIIQGRRTASSTGLTLYRFCKQTGEQSHVL